MDEKRVLCGRFAHLFFFFYDPLAHLIRFFYPDRKKKSISEAPKILLCCWASLGDVLLASFVIDSVKKKWPLAKIGFLCAPASFCVIEEHKEINYIHQVPSWMVLGQGKIRNLYSLMWHFFAIYPKAIREIKKNQYDVSIELHPFFPNCIPLARAARIAHRIGFTSGGYDVWLTDPVCFPKKWGYLPTLYPLLLERLGIEVKESMPIKQEVKNRRIVVLHMGTSDPRKEWSAVHFGSLGRFLKDKGYEIVMTGKGEKDQALILESGLASLGENLCDRLDFQGLSKVIKEAKMIISIDSLPIHLAALYGIPFIGLYLYNVNTELWLPKASNCYLLIHNRCICQKKSHPRGIYLEEIALSDVISYADKLLGEIS